jgi:S-adenosylmethionine synthetase
MANLVISSLSQDDEPVEIVERKGLGHPDSICDALAENLSRNLCRHYLERFGTILPHNVDKALLCGGSAQPAFGGGSVSMPIDIYLSGRSVTHVGDQAVPTEEIAIEGSRTWLHENLHAFDVNRHVRLHSVLRPGSAALSKLFARASTRERQIALANDTSFGVGYAPITALERLVLRIERSLNGRPRVSRHPAWGEDIKVMAVRHGRAVSVTVACAMIDRHLFGLDDYAAETAAIRRKVKELASEAGFDDCRIDVNAADDLASGSVYLTVTGTSAEAGDDGEVGRGNRANGLITAYRPMSLEAMAGKNPVSHVGKIYNVVARSIAETIVSDIAQAAAAQCYLVSRIGSPVTEPALVHARIATHDGSPASALDREVDRIVGQQLEGIGALVDRFVAGTIELY